MSLRQLLPHPYPAFVAAIVALSMSVGCNRLDATAFVGLYSASHALQAAFRNDLTRARLSELATRFSIELRAARGRASGQAAERVLREYEQALVALDDYGTVWDLEARTLADVLPLGPIGDELTERYGIVVERDSAIPVFSAFDALGRIGDAVLERLKTADADLLTNSRTRRID